MNLKVYTGFPADAMTVRETVFVLEQGFRDEFDQIDGYATHFVMYDGEKPVGVCRVFAQDGAYILGRLAVLKDYRGKKLGSRLVQAALEHVKSVGGRVMRLHSQCRAAGFYEKLGFTAYGEIEYEEDCPHIWMKKEI